MRVYVVCECVLCNVYWFCLRALGGHGGVLSIVVVVGGGGGRWVVGQGSFVLAHNFGPAILQ